jgi:aldehyde dehydrogenase (NAD+)
LYEVQVSDVEERSETSVDLGRRAAMHAESRMLIDGALVSATDGAEFDNVSPATGLVLGRTAAAQAQDMDRAIGAARTAFDATDWSTTVHCASGAWNNSSRRSRPTRRTCARN